MTNVIHNHKHRKTVQCHIGMLVCSGVTNGDPRLSMDLDDSLKIPPWGGGLSCKKSCMDATDWCSSQKTGQGPQFVGPLITANVPLGSLNAASFIGNGNRCDFEDTPNVGFSTMSEGHSVYSQAIESGQPCNMFSGASSGYNYSNELCHRPADQAYPLYRLQQQSPCKSSVESSGSLGAVGFPMQAPHNSIGCWSESSNDTRNNKKESISFAKPLGDNQESLLDSTYDKKVLGSSPSSSSSNGGATNSNNEVNISPLSGSGCILRSPSLQCVARPKSGRAKTNAELKRQLMERREQQRLREQSMGDSSSPVSIQRPDVSLLSVPSTTNNQTATNNLSTQQNSGAKQQVTTPTSSSTVLLVVGDILWAKVSGHPWWPCMVAPDPFQSNFTKLLPRGSKGMLRQYHVLFFGDEGERGWILESSAIPYAGRAAFDGNTQSLAGRSNVKGQKNYVIAPNRRRAWEIAVASAEHAWMLTREQRISEFLPATSISELGCGTGGGLSSSGGSHSENQVVSNLDSSQSNMSDHLQKSNAKRSIDDNGTVVKQARTDSSSGEHPVMLLPSREIKAVEFDAFRQSRRRRLSHDHPEYSLEKIDNQLKEEWNQMDNNARIRFAVASYSDCRNSRVVRTTDEAVSTPSRSSQKSNSIEHDRANHSTDVKLSPAAAKKRIRSSMDSADNSILVTPTKQVSPKLATGDWPRWEICAPTEANPIQICRACEGPCSLEDSPLTCTGPCLGVFHESCIQSARAPGVSDSVSFLCNPCQTGTHICFHCKSPSSQSRPTSKCSSVHCGRFYHEDCMRSAVCALHVCATCNRSDGSLIPTNDCSILCQCVRCPVAYHMNYTCLAAGCQFVGSRAIVCSRHVVPAKVHSHISTTWCLTCDKGGPLVHCEVCPASYHASCLPVAPASTANWRCHDCSQGRRPLYNDLVWVKYSNYRWWPGQICYPETVPLNIRDLPHDVGQFAVYFFGTRDYLWTHHARILSYRGKENGYLEQPTACKSLAKVFQKALKEVREAYVLWQAAKKLALNVPSTTGSQTDMPCNTPAKANESKDLSSKTCQSSGNNVDENCGSGLTSSVLRRSSCLNSPSLEKARSSSSAHPHCESTAPPVVSTSELTRGYQTETSGSFSIMDEFGCQGDTARASVKPPSVDSIAPLDDSSDGFPCLMVDVPSLR